MRIRRFVGTTIAALLVATSTVAARADCRQAFVGGQPPALLNPKLAGSSYPLCFTGSATLFCLA